MLVWTFGIIYRSILPELGGIEQKSMTFQVVYGQLRRAGVKLNPHTPATHEKLKFILKYASVALRHNLEKHIMLSLKTLVAVFLFVQHS